MQSVELCEFLLQHGANVNAQVRKIYLANRYSWTHTNLEYEDDNQAKFCVFSTVLHVIKW